MLMKSGNLAIQQSQELNKTIHAFEYTRKAHVRYLGTAEYIAHHHVERPDREGELRQAIVFHLDIDSLESERTSIQPTASNLPSYTPKELSKKSPTELRDIALRKPLQQTPKERVVAVHQRSEALKLYIRARAKGVCEGCGSEAPFETKAGPFLECHHIHRLSDGGPDNPRNVIGLCPNCHRRAHLAKDHKDFNNGLAVTAIEAEANFEATQSKQQYN